MLQILFASCKQTSRQLREWKVISVYRSHWLNPIMFWQSICFIISSAECSQNEKWLKLNVVKGVIAKPYVKCPALFEKRHTILISLMAICFILPSWWLKTAWDVQCWCLWLYAEVSGKDHSGCWAKLHYCCCSLSLLTIWTKLRPHGHQGYMSNCGARWEKKTL